MNSTAAGYREIEHTADWELEVWAPNLPGLLEQAARGMYTLARTRLEAGPRVRREIAVEAADEESLLVGFLSELLYLAEIDTVAFDTFQLRLEGMRLHAELAGAPLVSVDKEIKAVTWHNLRVRRDSEGLRVNIVFDV